MGSHKSSIRCHHKAKSPEVSTEEAAARGEGRKRKRMQQPEEKENEGVGKRKRKACKEA
jgi:hypothetical protein